MGTRLDARQANVVSLMELQTKFRPTLSLLKLQRNLSQLLLPLPPSRPAVAKSSPVLQPKLLFLGECAVSQINPSLIESGQFVECGQSRDLLL